MGKVQYYVTESGEKKFMGDVYNCLAGARAEESSEDEDEQLRAYLTNVPENIIQDIIRYRDRFPVVGPYKIDFMPNFPMMDGVGPINSEQYPKQYERAMSSLQFAIDQYNKDKSVNLVVEKVVRVNMRPTTGYLFYITFEAKVASGKVDVYCTKVWNNVIEKVMTVEEFFMESHV